MAAKYTRGRRPVTLVYEERQPDRSSALKREAALRRLGRAGKLALIATRRSLRVRGDVHDPVGVDRGLSGLLPAERATGFDVLLLRARRRVDSDLDRFPAGRAGINGGVLHRTDG